MNKKGNTQSNSQTNRIKISKISSITTNYTKEKQRNESFSQKVLKIKGNLKTKANFSNVHLIQTGVKYKINNNSDKSYSYRTPNSKMSGLSNRINEEDSIKDDLKYLLYNIKNNQSIDNIDYIDNIDNMNNSIKSRSISSSNEEKTILYIPTQEDISIFGNLKNEEDEYHTDYYTIASENIIVNSLPIISKTKQNFISMYSNISTDIKNLLLSYLDILNIVKLVKMISKTTKFMFELCSINVITEKIISFERKPNENHNFWDGVRFNSQIFRKYYKNQEFISKIYNEYKEKESNYIKEIDMDVERTLNKNKYNENYENNIDETRKIQVKSILNAYSNYNQSLGYAQGMNFIVNSIKNMNINDNEEMEFIILDSIICKLNMNNIFNYNNNEIMSINNTISIMIHRYIPTIERYFNSILVNHEFFSTNLIITLFSNSTISSILFKIWAFLLVFGWEFCLVFIIQILSFFENEILSQDHFSIANYMKNLLLSTEFIKNFQVILRSSMNMYISVYL